MIKSNKKVGIVVATAVGLFTLALVGISTAVAAPSASITTHASMVVTSIDRAARKVTLQSPDGESKTVSVPEDVKAFDTLKAGDNIDIDYTESVSVAVMPPGTKPSTSETTAAGRMAQGEGAAGREMTISGTVTSVDAKAHKVTFKGPNGKSQTVNVTDPAMQKKLPGLKVGQVVQLTYIEAIAVQIRPAAK